MRSLTDGNKYVGLQFLGFYTVAQYNHSLQRFAIQAELQTKNIYMVTQ